MIREYEFYHGFVFARLINSSPSPIGFRDLGSTGAYSVHMGDKSAGMYIKHNSDRLSPWRYTFLKDHQAEIETLKANFSEVFLVLVCGETGGIVVLNYQELKALLDHNHEATEWISVSRGKRQMYTVKGKDGALGYKVGKKDFPDKIITHLNAASEKPAEVLSMSEFENNFRLHSLAKSVRGIFGQRKVATTDR